MTPINPELLRQRRRQIHMKQVMAAAAEIEHEQLMQRIKDTRLQRIKDTRQQYEEMVGRIVMVETPVSEPFWRFCK